MVGASILAALVVATGGAFTWRTRLREARVERLRERIVRSHHALERAAARWAEPEPPPSGLPSSDSFEGGMLATLDSVDAHLRLGAPLSDEAESRLARLAPIIQEEVDALPSVGDTRASNVEWGPAWRLVAAWLGRLPPELCMERYARFLYSFARVVAERARLVDSIGALRDAVHRTWRVPIRCAIAARSLPDDHARAWGALRSLDLHGAALVQSARFEREMAVQYFGLFEVCVERDEWWRGERCREPEAYAVARLEEMQSLLDASARPSNAQRFADRGSLSGTRILLVASDAAQRVAVLGCDGIRDLRHPLPAGTIECDGDTLVMSPGIDGEDELRLRIPDDVVASAIAPTRRRTAAMTVRAALGARRDVIEAAWGAPIDTSGIFVDYGRGRLLRYHDDVAVEARGSARERGEVSLEEWLGVPREVLDACTRTREGSCAFELDDVHGERRADVYRLWPRGRETAR